VVPHTAEIVGAEIRHAPAMNCGFAGPARAFQALYRYRLSLNGARPAERQLCSRLGAGAILSQPIQMTVKNRILKALPSREFEMMAKTLTRVDLALGETLHRAGDTQAARP
jgi:hypothetical protein